MNIYELSHKELSEKLREFGKTYYGKIAFLLAYIIPFIFTLAIIITFITFLLLTPSCFVYNLIVQIVLLIFTIITLISFVLGSRYYYHELKMYIEISNKDKKKTKNR